MNKILQTESAYSGSIKCTEDLKLLTGPKFVKVQLSNDSNLNWLSNGCQPVNLSYHWLDEQWQMVIFDGERTPLPEQGLASGVQTSVDVLITPPEKPGTYHLALTCVKEGVCWFDSVKEFKSDILKVSISLEKNVRLKTKGIKVLFFLEPAVYSTPDFLSAHFFWVDYFVKLCEKAEGTLALFANTETCNMWNVTRPQYSGVESFPIDSESVLSAFLGCRPYYSRALYGEGTCDNTLTCELTKVKSAFNPDLIVASSQNAFLGSVFSTAAFLYIEQSPLPRLGHPLRSSFDPFGHQVGSFIERYADELVNLCLTDSIKESINSILIKLSKKLNSLESVHRASFVALKELRKTGPVALLVTQPPDWVSCEGAAGAVKLDDLLLEWAASLPEGWTGVPTYHTAHKLTADEEARLRLRNTKLKFLPFAQGITEALLLEADGMVTVSSTSAITALLFQKPVVVVGKSPFAGLCPKDPSSLNACRILTKSEVGSLFAFLTHRYSWSHAEILENPAVLLSLVETVIADRKCEAWFMDVSTWDKDRAERFFCLTC